MEPQTYRDVYADKLREITKDAFRFDNVFDELSFYMLACWEKKETAKKELQDKPLSVYSTEQLIKEIERRGIHIPKEN